MLELWGSDWVGSGRTLTCNGAGSLRCMRHLSRPLLFCCLHSCMPLLLQAFLTKLLTVDLPELMVLPKRLEINIPPAVTAGTRPGRANSMVCRLSAPPPAAYAPSCSSLRLLASPKQGGVGGGVLFLCALAVRRPRFPHSLHLPTPFHPALPSPIVACSGRGGGGARRGHARRRVRGPAGRRAGARAAGGAAAGAAGRRGRRVAARLVHWGTAGGVGWAGRQGGGGQQGDGPRAGQRTVDEAARRSRGARRAACSLTPPLPHPTASLRLQVTLHEARDLPVWGFPWQSNPYCRMTLGSQAVQVRGSAAAARPTQHGLPAC